MNAVSITKLHHKLVAVTAERDRLAAELQKLREQKPIGEVIEKAIIGSTITYYDNELVCSLPIGTKIYTDRIPAPAVQDASLIPQGFQVWHNTDNPDLTDDANNEHRWIVERLYKPWSGTSGARRWFGKTLESAMRNAISDLGMVMPAMPAPGELVEAGGCAPAIIAAPAVPAPSVPNNEFVQHLKKCKQDVEGWPEWKKQAAGIAPAATTPLSDDKLISLIYKHFGTEDHPRIVYESGPLCVTKLTYGMRALADAIIAEASIQQAALGVPEEWRKLAAEFATVGCHELPDNEVCTCSRCERTHKARALLQSAEVKNV